MVLSTISLGQGSFHRLGTSAITRKGKGLTLIFMVCKENYTNLEHKEDLILKDGQRRFVPDYRFAPEH